MSKLQGWSSDWLDHIMTEVRVFYAAVKHTHWPLYTICSHVLCTCTPSTDMKEETEVGSKCALHGEIVESSKNSHTVQSWSNWSFLMSILLCCKVDIFLCTCYTLKHQTLMLIIWLIQRERMELKRFQIWRKTMECWKELSHDPPHGKANVSVVKGLTHSGSGVNQVCY